MPVQRYLSTSYIFVSATCRKGNSPGRRLRAEPLVKLMGEAWSARSLPVRALAGACLHLQKRTSPLECSLPTTLAPAAHKSGSFKSCLQIQMAPAFLPGYCRHSWRVNSLSVEVEIGRTKQQQSNCFRVWQVITESAKLQ